jgi:hypothetical protein
MAELNETGIKTFEADEALEQYRRVKMDADGKVTYADAGDASDGITDREAFAAGDLIGVRLRSCPGTRKVVASGAISAGDYVYGDDDGKVSSDGYVLEGKAVSAASGDGSIIEIMPNVGPENNAVDTIAAAGSAQGDAEALTGSFNTVTGADGTKGVVLPAARAGLKVDVYNSVATNGLKVYPATGDDINDGTTNAAITIEGKTLASFTAVDATTWAAQFTADT